MSRTRSALRAYLEQRIEGGEREIVFDTLTAAGALEAASGEARPLGKASGGHSSPEPTERTVDVGGSWRDALRAAGAAPAGERVAESGLPERSGAVESEHLDRTVRDGLVVGEPAEPAAGGAASELASFESLDQIAAAVATCTRCPLYATAKHPVPGEGHPKARLMLVGEAPGATEDETGRPFVGAAGQLLTKILQAIALERDDVFICNVLKHRPPGNRNPLPEEVRACRPYLLRQIELIGPQVIIALGTFAAQTLLDTKLTIGKLRGQVHRYYGVPLVVTYHPAALLRNPAWKRPTWEDVQLARQILDAAPPPVAGA
ncbi:MAG TPA: uracil-DNA glycosylase [Gemmatimonadaceae bacterium]|nr:uracil-DNA glycosylase [Gemmatimonadaceae bacterium]